MVVITRADLSNGYKSQQSTHSIADFAYEFPQSFKDWKENSNSIICLQVNNETQLLEYYNKLSKLTSVVKFNEPDINDEATSICLYADKDVRKKVSSLPLLGKPTKLTKEKVIADMANTPQTDTQSVLEHGIAVSKKFSNLISNNVEDWKLPTWFTDNREFLFENLHTKEILEEYHILHDIGKPYCITIDDDGRRHFPNHAEVSYDTYRQISDNEIVSDLIKKDMILHTIKSAEVEEFVNENSLNTILTLLITSLCEIHANSDIFGGINSTSFKVKLKQIDRRGNQIIKLLKK